ncbi:hypothetical protein PybrP1_009751 [[Pythium] brassicae (nom. inval.)]|nr:hypothetical protein PybrP1_009751 [[Pythium] brassicae (nom. inval.)]
MALFLILDLSTSPTVAARQIGDDLTAVKPATPKHVPPVAKMLLEFLNKFHLAAAYLANKLPIVVVSPITARLPRDPCMQKPLPAPDCLKEPVQAVVEVVDHRNGSLNCFLDPRTSLQQAAVHYRGQSSLHFSKHQLAVTLNQGAEFLGFPSDTQFVLHGPTIDSSLLRNHLAHWLYRGTTRYSPRTRHVVLFVRDREDPTDFTPEYKGIYLALEKISYGPSRVGLAPLDASCRGSELSGGWAWQINPLNYGVYSPNIVRDKYETAFGSGERPVLTYPSGEQLTQRMRDYFVDSTTSPLSRLYRALYENMTSPETLDVEVDIGSFVDYFLHTEMSQNTDAYRRSTYFFKDRGQPINAGPVWDFNLAYGTGANQLDWLYKPFSFWKRLTCHYKFASLVPKRWRELRAGVWSDEAITDFLGNASMPIHRQLTKCSNWTSNELYCANVRVGGGTFTENVEALRQTVVRRAAWMDGRVASFFMALNASTCVPVGTLPKFNCASNGNDDGCLRDPDAYMDAVAFPSDTTGDKSNATLDTPSVDFCWLSVGVSVAQSALTPFCSGYGYCATGPGAVCKCIKGKQPPSCAAAEVEVPVQEVATTTLSSPSPLPTPSFAMSPYLAAGYIVVLTLSIGGAVAVFCRQHRVGTGESSGFARETPASYGT